MMALSATADRAPLAPAARDDSKTLLANSDVASPFLADALPSTRRFPGRFEWMLGYRPTFGITAVDRATHRRTVKDRAGYLGGVARRNALT